MGMHWRQDGQRAVGLQEDGDTLEPDDGKQLQHRCQARLQRLRRLPRRFRAKQPRRVLYCFVSAFTVALIPQRKRNNAWFPNLLLFLLFFVQNEMTLLLSFRCLRALELLEHEYCYLKNKLHELFQACTNSYFAIIYTPQTYQTQLLHWLITNVAYHMGFHFKKCR